MQVQQDSKVPVFKHVQKEYKVPVLIQFKRLWSTLTVLRHL